MRRKTIMTTAVAVVALTLLTAGAVYAQTTIPDWVKEVAGFWADGLINDDEYASTIQYLIEQGIITIPIPEKYQNIINEHENTIAAQEKQIEIQGTTITKLQTEINMLKNKHQGVIDQPNPSQNKGKVKVVHEPNPTPGYIAMRTEGVATAQDFIPREILEKYASLLDRSLKLPYDVTLRATECGEANAYYNPATKEVIMCYEFADYLMKLGIEEGQFSAGQATRFTMSNLQFVFLHELGHALIDIYDLPITGKEENVADQFAIIQLHRITENYTDPDGLDYNKMILVSAQQAFAHAHNVESRTPGYSHPYWAEHDSSAQRFGNISCLLYGADPTKYSFIVPDILPQSRAVFCPDVFERASGAWKVFLKDHRPSD